VIIGENRTFDHLFATYQPKPGETVNNLLSEGIITTNFGDGTRIPLIAVSPYTVVPGHISHAYADHVSVLKFIERNWYLNPVTNRSRNNFPNPILREAAPMFPRTVPQLVICSICLNFHNLHQTGPGGSPHDLEHALSNCLLGRFCFHRLSDAQSQLLCWYR